MVKQRIKIDKKDKYRALLTDTYPGDVPVIFSNDGFYINCHTFNAKQSSGCPPIINSFYKTILGPSEKQSNPYKYSITKNDISLRTLSLIHPRSQMNFCNFYASYSSIILYLCSKSKASIRAPHKVSNSLFLSDKNENSKYKEIDIDTLEEELFQKHSSSFFSYRKHNRLYKLFESPEYIQLEKKYSTMWMLDISNCFNSIYTHAISWCIKNKEYIKDNVDYKNQFCNQFDQLMQRSNNNETNGIPIGSEISRVFSEIMLQSIDCLIISAIEENHGCKFDTEYVFLRYVDDYIVFSENEKIAKQLANEISDKLSEINLYISSTKLQKYSRPFNTNKSSIITQAKNLIQDFETRLFEEQKIDGKKFLRPKKINNTNSLIKHFINQIKYICGLQNEGYINISSYLVSTLSNRIIRLIEGETNNIKGGLKDDDEADKLRQQYREALMVILDLMFFFYTVCPQVPSASKLSKTIIIMDNFFSKKYEGHIDRFRGRVMESIMELSFNKQNENNRKRFVSLESLNILLSTSEFGENYLIPEEKLWSLLDPKCGPSYFFIVSLLYYIKDHSKYDSIRVHLEQRIIKLIENEGNLEFSSETAHLFLDSLSCPYLSQATRLTILDIYLQLNDQDLDESVTSKEKYLDDLQTKYWFIKWRKLDLIKLLERKELNNAY